MAAHLDPNTDAASRRPETIEAIVDWLASHLDLQPGDSVIDLGCGPGLYTSRLARRGLRVTGVDSSPNSLEYARRQAQEQGLDIEYVLGSYVELDYQDRFDVALLIYFDFGVLPDDDRRVPRRCTVPPPGAPSPDITTPHWPHPADGTATGHPPGGFEAGPPGAHAVFPSRGRRPPAADTILEEAHDQPLPHLGP